MYPSFLWYQTPELDNIHTDGIDLPSLSHWENIDRTNSWLNNKGFLVGPQSHLSSKSPDVDSARYTWTVDT